MASNSEEVRQNALRELARRELERRSAQAVSPGQTMLSSLDSRNPAALTGSDPISGQSAANAPVSVSSPIVRGVAEAGLQLAAGAVTEPLIGIAGTVDALGRTVGNVLGTGGGNPVMAAAEDMGAMRDAVQGVVEPRTEVGRQITETIAKPFVAIEGFVDDLSEKVPGGPIVQSAVKTLLLGSPSLLPVRGMLRNRSGRQAASQAVLAEARRLGLDFRSPELRRQVRAAAEGRASDTAGAGMTDVQRQLIDLADANRRHVDDLYADARSTTAELDSAGMAELGSRARSRLEGERDFDLADNETFRHVNRRLERLDELVSQSTERAVMLDEVEKVRRQINANRPPRRNESGNLALDELKREIDSWMDDMLNRDMIRGEPEALQAWKDARSANQAYRARFRDDKVIRQLVENHEATPETMRAWVFGAGKTGFQREAATVVRRMKGLLGEDSAQIKNLRMEAALHIIDPLMDATPDFSRFVNRYDNFVRNNQSVMRELDIDVGELKFLRDVAEAADKAGAAPLQQIDLVKSGTQLVFGHDISRQGMIRRNAEVIVRSIQGRGRSERRRILREMVDFRPESPMLSGAAFAAVLQSEAERAETEGQ